MRLTLRVLLAYLDNILEPADAKIVEAKIAESENVSTLVHHIREITKRMRIGAPEVLGQALVERLADHAADVVCLEDRSVGLHRGSPLSLERRL